jgi:HSP20 family protein
MTSLTSTFNFKPFFSRMTVDMKETDNEIVINAEIPNIDKSNLDVEINNNMLTISAERKEETSNSTTKSHISEISYGKILRSIILPTKVDKDKIKAQYVNGMLTIVLPKVI